jgi:hypothetical protein
MMVSPKPAALIVIASLAATMLPAHADGRAELVTCQAMIDRAAQAAQASTSTAASPQEEAALQRCRQIVRDWTLRESRMTVDEQGRPLR